MEQFAVEQLFAGRIDSCLAVIYQKMLYLDLIDGQMAKVLPEILKSHCITCRDSSMSYVVVRHEELMTEDAYPLKEGKAFVPLFSDRDVLFFQDSYGNRYLNLPYEKKAVMEDTEELLACCFEMAPTHPLLFVGACRAALSKEELSGDDAALLERCLLYTSRCV